MYELPGIAKDIVLIRCGQSSDLPGEPNDAGNPGLSELGKKQMTAVKARLDQHTYDFVYVSPLLRAYQSYQIASPKACYVELDNRITENNVGRNWYQSMVGYLPADRLTCRCGDGWLIPCEKRAEMIAANIAANGAEKILIFGHQEIIKCLIATWLGVDGVKLLENLVLDNGSFTGLLLDSTGCRRVKYVNDSSHLTFAQAHQGKSMNPWGQAELQGAGAMRQQKTNDD